MRTWALLACHWRSPLYNQKGSQFCCIFFSFTPLSWENLPELIHRSQHMNFQSGISRIFQCGSSFVNLASVACVVGKGNVNRIWSLGQGIALLISKKDFKNRAHLACSMSVMFLWFWSASSTSDHQNCPSRHGHMLLSCTLSTGTKEVKEKRTTWLKRAEKGKKTTAHTVNRGWQKMFSVLYWWIWHPSICCNPPLLPAPSISNFSSCALLSSVTIVPRADVQSSQI